MRTLPMNMEACPVRDDGKRVKRLPELSEKHATVPWGNGLGKQGRSGFACVKCSKTWEWLNISPQHVRLKATYDITDRERAYATS